MKTINIAKRGDCGFLSVAACLIDVCRQGRLFELDQQRGLGKFLSLYQEIYPADLPNSDWLSQQHKFQHLINYQHPSILIEKLAYVLRQFAVDLIVANAPRYCGAFITNAATKEGVSPAEMRKPGTWIDGTAIAALAHAFRMRVRIQCDRFSTELYDIHQKPKVGIHLMLLNGHYQPQVDDSDYFLENKTVAAGSILGLKPVEIYREDPEWEGILVQIKKVEALDKMREFQAKKLFSALSVPQLVSIYQKAMQKSDYLTGKIVAVTQEYEDDLFFFNAVISQQVKVEDKSRIKKILVHALSKQAYIDSTFDAATLCADIQKSMNVAPRNSALFPNHCATELQQEAHANTLPLYETKILA